ncbi:MAG: hypothetical protein JJT96_12940 [Opitutales bacterium]|nr:hypothetical protein [Opitutales bacterium]
METAGDIERPRRIGSAVWRVGFSGHRQVTDEVRLAAKLDTLWGELAQRVEGTLEGCTGLAEGADILFAESTVRAGWPLQLRLPYPLGLFREEMGEGVLARFDRLVAMATAVDAPEMQGDRNSAYHQGGIDVLDHADIMVFFWDGAPERGHGGTAQIVRAARARKTPLVWVHAHSLAVTFENFPSGVLRDAIAGKIAPLLHPLSKRPTEGKGMNGAADLFQVLDEAASQSAPRHRFIAAYNIIVHVVAIIVGVLALAYASGFWGASAGYVKLALILSTLVFYFYAKYRKLHYVWLTCRTGAELARSLLATANLLRPSERESLLDPFSEYRRVLRPLAATPYPIEGERNFLEYRDHYVATRIEEQRCYFERSAKRLFLQKRVLAGAFMVFSFGGLACALSYLFLGWGGFKVLVVVLPLLSMMVISLSAALDIDRRRERFRDMAVMTEAAAQRLRGVEDAAVLRREVLRQERLLLQEVAEWTQQTRHLHIH